MRRKCMALHSGTGKKNKPLFALSIFVTCLCETLCYCNLFLHREQGRNISWYFSYRIQKNSSAAFLLIRVRSLCKDCNLHSAPIRCRTQSYIFAANLQCNAELHPSQSNGNRRGYLCLVLHWYRAVCFSLWSRASLET